MDEGEDVAERDQSRGAGSPVNAGTCLCVAELSVRVVEQGMAEYRADADKGGGRCFALQAAAIPEVWLTAYQLLHRIGHVRAGETVLVHAAASGVPHGLGGE